ncbi:hypothetical protein HRbin40_01233 [bacterium HR40]|nr:hypothetical protein HRbin40_01233 [bacterium HR40]
MRKAADRWQVKRILLLCAGMATACSGTTPFAPGSERETAALDRLIPAAGGTLSCPDRLRLLVEGGPEARDAPALAVRSLDPAAAIALSAGFVRREELPQADCLLLLDRVRITESEVRPLGSLAVEVERVVSRRKIANPERAALERRLAELRQERRGDRRDILRTGDPTVDLVGLAAQTLVDVVDTVAGRGAEMARLEEELARTPPTREEETVERLPLAVERSAVRVRGKVRVALVDPRHELVWQGEVPVEEVRTYALLPASAPRDVRFPSTTDLVPVRDRSVLDAARSQPPAVAIAAIARALLDRPLEPPARLALADLERRWRQEDGSAGEARALSSLSSLEPAAPPRPTVRLDPRVVVVRDEDGDRALAFYIGPEHLLTLARTLPTTTLVPVGVAPGLVTYGLVESRDEARDLALLWVPRRGEPLRLADSGGAGGAPLGSPFAASDELPGAPVVDARGVTAIRRAPESADMVPLSEILGFLAQARERDGVGLAIDRR